MNIKEIKSNPNNPRIIKDEKFAKLKKSISEFPKMMELRPMVINSDNIVLGGNMRLKALKELGYTDIPNEWIKRADELTEDETRRFIIADNVGFGEHDWEMLANEWDTQELEDWGLEGFPFDDATELEAEEDDYEQPDDIQVDVVLGDLIEIGEHRLLCGDSTDSDQVAKLMDGEKANMVFTDPPYGVSYEGGHNQKKRKGIENDTLKDVDLSDLFKDSLNVACVFTESNAPFYIWYASGKSMETYEGLSHTLLQVRAVICWYKVNSGLGAFMSQYIPNYEPMIYAHKIGESIQWFGPTDEKTVWELKNDQKNKLHPTQKPIELPKRAIINSSKQGQIIYDSFLGGGSTMVAAHQLKRKCYGMELDPKYCQVIIDRMSKLDSSLDIKINGKPYEVVEK
jgi:DNA modification methylase